VWNTGKASLVEMRTAWTLSDLADAAEILLVDLAGQKQMTDELEKQFKRMETSGR
jgi:hypothetical protein